MKGTKRSIFSRWKVEGHVSCQNVKSTSVSDPGTFWATVDEARSRLRRVQAITCEECRSTAVAGIYGFKVQLDTWDGLDVFRPRGLQSDVVVSERFADFVQRHGFTNIKLVPTEQYVWDPYRRGPPVEAARA